MFSNIGKIFCSKVTQVNPILNSISSVFGMLARGMANQRHKKVLRLAKGFRGRSNRCYSLALRRLQKARQYAFEGRKVKLVIAFSSVS